MHRNIHFKNPPHANIVIFEKIGSGRITNLILPDKPVFVFDSMLEDIFLGIHVISNFTLNLNLFKIKSLKNKKSIFRGFVGQLWRIYIFSVIKVINPKIVITLIDNNSVFHWLCENYEGAEFMAIQNGNRTRAHLNHYKFGYLQHYFSFGDYEKDLFSELGFKVEKYHPVGSLLAGYYIHEQNLDQDPIYDICVISSWRGNIGNTDDVKNSMKAMKKLDYLLSRYIQETHIKVSIVLRSEPESEHREIPDYGNEKEYYQNIYPDSVVLIDPDFASRNVYTEILKGDLIISMGSTLTREAFGFGKKILYCDFTESDLYNDYNTMILFKEQNYESLKNRINELLKMPKNEYKNNTEEYASYLMSNNIKCPPHLVIRKTIDYYLGIAKNDL
jgi:surface carbohydrate biosynthesis protein